MSGVFAVIDPERRIENLDRVAEEMGGAMSHRDWFVAERWVDETERVAIGRIGIGIFNRTPQPVWNVARTAAVVMAGEIYAVDGRTPPALAAPEQLVLNLYAEFAEAFVTRLDGVFIIALWDGQRRSLLIANDRFGTYPLFYSWRTGTLVCAPEMKGVLCDTSLSRRIDLVALAQYMRFQHLFGRRTFFEGVESLPAASLMVHDVTNAALTVRPYWTFDEIPYRPSVSLDEAAEETGRLLRRAVQRLSSDAHRPGVYLSGGLDSRTILGLVERRPIASLTYGSRNCRDVHYAHRIARAVRSDHLWCEFADGNWVRQHAAFHLELTEGFHSWIHAHGISTLTEARRLMDVDLTGWDGAAVMAGPPPREYHVPVVDDATLVTTLFHRFNQSYTWPSLTEAEEGLLYCERLRGKMRGLAFDSFRDELASFFAHRPDVRSEYFYLRNHCGRMTGNMVVFVRSHIEVRFPFFDYALFDFLYSLPSSRRGYELYRAVIEREAPRLAYIPYERDEFLPCARRWVRQTHALTRRLQRRFNRHVWPLFRERHTLYADYESYLRGELRDWGEDILFDKRTRERGIFDPRFVRALMDRHLSGLEEWTIGKIAPIMTYEMMLRRFLD